MPEITDDYMGAAQSVRACYRVLEVDLADAVNVAPAADYDTDAILAHGRRDSAPFAP